MKNLNKHIFSVAAGIISLVVYIITLNPTVTFMDSGELAAACATFGIPHPTGYPLYLVIGFLFSKLPFSASPVYNLNLLSAVMSAAAVVVFFYCLILFVDLLREIKPVKQRQQNKQKKQKNEQPEYRRSEAEIVLIAFFSSLVFAFSRTFWLNADTIEVYPLHTLFIIIIIFFCLKIFSDLKAENKKIWILLFVFLGLSFANHMTTIFLLPGIVFVFYIQYRANPIYTKSVTSAAIYIIPGLLLYIILFIRASAQPYLNWSDPSNFSNFMHHVTGGDYSQLMFSASSVFAHNSGLFFSSVLSEFAIASGIIAVIGLISVYFKNKNLFYFLLILIVSCLLYSLNYNIRDVLVYFILVYVVLGITFAAGLIRLLDYLVKNINLEKNVFAATIVLGLVLAGWSFKFNYTADNNSSNYAVEDITLNALNQVKPNAIIMSFDWGYIYPASIYYQQVGKVREDVKVFNVKFLSVSWYLDMIKKYYPDIYENCKPEIESYLPAIGNESTAPSKLSALVKAFIVKNNAKYPFYMTYDFAYSKEIRQLITDYLIIPDGFLYRLVNKNAPYDSTAGMNSLDMKFRKYEPDTDEKEKTYIFTAGVYYDNAVYHNNHKNSRLALKFLDKAIELRSDFKEAAALKSQILDGTKGK